MSVERLNPPSHPAPVGHYSHIATVPAGHKIMMLAGQLGPSEDGGWPESVEEQFENAINTCMGLLRSVGADADAIVKVTYYLTSRPQDFSRIRAAIVGAFGSRPPAATYLIVSGLARPEMKVEIDIMAAVPE